jgi:hypothetical protein
MMSEASLFMKAMSASMGFLPVRSAGWQHVDLVCRQGYSGAL